jgi:hypothetical protein
MICKELDYNGRAQTSAFTLTSTRKLCYPFYNIGTRATFKYAAENVPTSIRYIMFNPENYKISDPYFYRANFRLIADIFAFLLSQYERPLEISFVKVKYAKQVKMLGIMEMVLILLH